MEEYIEAAKKKALEILQKETIAPLDLEVLSVLSKIICDANAFVAMSIKNRLSQSRGVSRAWTGSAVQPKSEENSAEIHAE